MILMNLFTGKEWRHRRREETCGHSEGKRVGWMEKVASNTYTTMHKTGSG